MSRSPTRYRPLLFLIWAIAMLATLLPPARVQAHAAFLRAVPEPNSVLPEHAHEVTIWFTEPLEPQFSEIQVLDTQGKRVDSGNSRLLEDDPMAMTVSLPTLPDGTYTVAWRNVSTVDGHTLRGSYVLSFGEAIPGAATAEATTVAERAPLEGFARGLVLVGALALVGGLLFERLLIVPVFFKAGVSAATVALGVRLLRRARRVMWLALLLFTLSSLYQLVGQAITLFNIPLAQLETLYVSVVLRTTDWGNLWIWRMWLFSIVAIYLIAEALIAAPVEEEDTVSRIAKTLALFAGLGMLFTLSLASHAAAMGPLRVAAIFSDYLHLLASAVWVGGLFHLALAAYPLYRLQASARGPLLAQIIPRFSTLAMLSVGTLVITGLYSAWAQVTIPAALTTPYGLTLLAKLALFVPLLALGAFNLFRVSPRLRGEGRAASWLQRTVSVESLLALAIILIVGVLTGLEPARQVAARQGLGQERAVTHEDSVEGTQIAVTIEPSVTGNNDITVTLQDALGRPLANAEEVAVELTYLNTDLGPTLVTAQPGAEAGQYVAEDILLSVAGDWQSALLVRRPDAFDARTAFRFDIQAGQSLEVATQAGFVLWGIELVLLGVLFVAVSLPLGAWRTRPGLRLATPGALALLAGIAIAFTAPLLAASVDATPTNPFPPTSESIALGEQIYTNACASCHGPQGGGDGPAGAGLVPPPADLTFHVPLHPDYELFNTIMEGKPGTAMPAFSDQLAEDEIWQLINYLRTLEEAP